MGMKSLIEGIIDQPCESTQIYFQSDIDIPIVIEKVKNNSVKFHIKAMLKDSSNNVVAYVYISPGQMKSLASEKATSFAIQCRICPHGQVWDQPQCKCVTCAEQPCSGGYVWDPEECKCVPCSLINKQVDIGLSSSIASPQVSPHIQALDCTKVETAADCNCNSQTNSPNNYICKGAFSGNILIG